MYASYVIFAPAEQVMCDLRSRSGKFSCGEPIIIDGASGSTLPYCDKALKTECVILNVLKEREGSLRSFVGLHLLRMTYFIVCSIVGEADPGLPPCDLTNARLLRRADQQHRRALADWLGKVRIAGTDPRGRDAEALADRKQRFIRIGKPDEHAAVRFARSPGR